MALFGKKRGSGGGGGGSRGGGKGAQLAIAAVAVVATVATAGLAAPIGASVLAGTSLAGSSIAASTVGGAIIGTGIGAAAGGASGSLTGDFGQGLLTGAATGGAGGAIGGAVTGSLSGVAPTEVVQAASGAARGATTAGITGQDVGTGALAGGVAGGIAGAAGQNLQGVLPAEVIPAVTGTLSGAGASAVRGGDILQGAAVGGAGGALGSAVQDLITPTPPQPGVGGDPGPFRQEVVPGGEGPARPLQPGEELLSALAGIVGVAPGTQFPGPEVELPQLPAYDPNAPLPMPEPSGQVIEVTKDFDVAAGPDAFVVEGPSAPQEVPGLVPGIVDYVMADQQRQAARAGGAVPQQPAAVPQTPEFALTDVYTQVPDIVRFIEADMARTGTPQRPATTTAGLGFGGGGMTAQDRQIADLIGYSSTGGSSQTARLGAGEAPSGRARGGETGTGAAGTGTGAGGEGTGTGGGTQRTYYSSTGVGPSGYRSQLPGILAGGSPAGRSFGLGAGGPEGFAPMGFDGGERKLKPQRPVWNIASLRVKEDEGVS